MKNTNVHTEHCCSIHGCKYSQEDCPVETGIQTQSHPCAECDVNDIGKGINLVSVYHVTCKVDLSKISSQAKQVVDSINDTMSNAFNFSEQIRLISTAECLTISGNRIMLPAERKVIEDHAQEILNGKNELGLIFVSGRWSLGYV